MKNKTHTARIAAMIFPAGGGASERDLEFFSEVFICPASGESLRSVGAIGVGSVRGPETFYPVVKRRVLFSTGSASTAAAEPSGKMQAAALWLTGIIAKDGLAADAIFAEFMPVDLCVAGELEKAGARVAGIMCPTDAGAPASVLAAVVPSYAEIPARAETFDGILILDPRLWRSGLDPLLREAARLLKPGGRLWMLAPVKGGPLHAWAGQFDGLGLMRGVIRRRIEQALRPASAAGAAGVARWLVTALRKVRKWDGMLEQPAFDTAVAAAGLGTARAVVPEIGLICLEKPAADDGGIAASDADWRVPSNYRAPDSSDAALQRDTEYALCVFASYCEPLPGGVDALRGKAVLELGPGNNLAVCLCLAAFGARVYAVDRYPVRWAGEYHPKLYSRVRDELRRRFPSASAEPFDMCIEFAAHPSGAVWQLPCPAESIALPDQSVDITASCAVLEHLFDARLAAQELARITRPGGWAVHQVDFRDHRDFTRPLEYLLLGQEEFRKLFDSCHAECGNRIRPSELSRFLTEAGFGIERIHGNCHSDAEYLAGFLPRLRAATESGYRDWPEEHLRDTGALLVARRVQTPDSPRDLPVLVWDRERSAHFWRRVSGSDYLVSKAFSRICGDPLLDMLRKVLRKDWKFVDFGSGANGFIIQKMLARGLRVASFEPSRGPDSQPYPFVSHPLYLGEAVNGRDGEFDCVLVTEVIEHVHEEDFPGFMRRVRALVKPGGWAIFTTPNREDIKSGSVFCPVAEVLFHPWQHLRSWSPELLEAFLRDYGFEPIAVHQVDFTSMHAETEKRRLVAGMLNWLKQNLDSVPEVHLPRLIEHIHAMAISEQPVPLPALPLRGRGFYGHCPHLIFIGRII